MKEQRLKIYPNASPDMKYCLTSPIMVLIPRKRKADQRVYLNINTYRNLHFQVNNNAKIIYKQLMTTQIESLPVFGKIKLLFVLHKGSRRKTDRHNICSIVQKFFCDALVELGKLQDDNDDFIISEKYEAGEVIKGGACCKIYIKEVE